MLAQVSPSRIPQAHPALESPSSLPMPHLVVPHIPVASLRGSMPGVSDAATVEGSSVAYNAAAALSTSKRPVRVGIPPLHTGADEPHRVLDDEASSRTPLGLLPAVTSASGHSQRFLGDMPAHTDHSMPKPIYSCSSRLPAFFSLPRNGSEVPGHGNPVHVTPGSSARAYASPGIMPQTGAAPMDPRERAAFAVCGDHVLESDSRMAALRDEVRARACLL
jgi:hypothetical protein